MRAQPSTPATNTHNELFGSERMLAVLNEDPDAKPETILDNVLRNVDESVGGAEQFDDLTMLCFKYRHRSEDDEDA